MYVCVCKGSGCHLNTITIWSMLNWVTPFSSNCLRSFESLPSYTGQTIIMRTMSMYLTLHLHTGQEEGEGRRRRGLHHPSLLRRGVWIKCDVSFTILYWYLPDYTQYQYTSILAALSYSPSLIQTCPTRSARRRGRERGGAGRRRGRERGRGRVPSGVYLWHNILITAADTKINRWVAIFILS